MSDIDTYVSIALIVDSHYRPICQDHSGTDEVVNYESVSTAQDAKPSTESESTYVS